MTDPVSQAGVVNRGLITAPVAEAYADKLCALFDDILALRKTLDILPAGLTDLRHGIQEQILRRVAEFVLESGQELNLFQSLTDNLPLLLTRFQRVFVGIRKVFEQKEKYGSNNPTIMQGIEMMPQIASLISEMRTTALRIGECSIPA